MEEGTFVEWLKRDGEAIKPGDPLFALESDKATENIEAIDAGLLRMTADSPRPGDRVKVGQAIGFLAATDEAMPARDAASANAAAPAAIPVAGPAVRRLAQSLGVNLTQVAGSGPGGRIMESDLHAKTRAPAAVNASDANPGRRRPISPRARRAARELGIDPNAVTGSGRNGRIRERDIRKTPSPDQAGKLIPHSAIRRTIAARMVAGVTQAAPVTLTTQADATNLVNLRGQFKSTAADQSAPTYTDLIVKLAALALAEHPHLQAQWREEGLFVPDRIDIAIAVDTEAGLLAPVVRGVDRLTLRQVAASARELVALARAGRLTADRMRDATFTVSNLGMYGVDAFTPILHLPQCAVLGIGRIVRTPVLVEDRVEPRHLLTLSLTFDHRVVDGAPAAHFLAALRQGIENPVPRLVP